MIAPRESSSPVGRFIDHNAVTINVLLGYTASAHLGLQDHLGIQVNRRRRHHRVERTVSSCGIFSPRGLRRPNVTTIAIHLPHLGRQGYPILEGPPCDRVDTFACPFGMAREASHNNSRYAVNRVKR